MKDIEVNVDDEHSSSAHSKEGHQPLTLLNHGQDEVVVREDTLQRRLHPKTRGDFKTLYSELDIWQRSEYTNTNKSTSEALKILWKETKLIQKIDSLQKDVRHSKHQQHFENQVITLINPVRWNLSDGSDIEIHRPIMEYAKALHNLHTLLMSCYSVEFSAEQKLKSLNTVRDALNVMDSLRTRDLLDVMDRQIYLLSRGRRFSTELKNRTLHLFVHYMEDELGIKRKILRKST